MRKIIFTYLFVSFAWLLSAQSDFRPGYVLKIEGDTLNGEIDYRADGRMGKICVFRRNANDTLMKFLPNEILGYRFTNDKYYVSKEVGGEKVFLEYLIQGKLDIYYLRNKLGDSFYFSKDSVPLTKLPNEDRLVRDEYEVLYSLKNTKYQGLLIYYLQDVPKILPEINKLKILDQDNLIALAENYHKAVCDGEKCIIYTKKILPFKLSLEITGGIVKGLYDYNVNHLDNYTKYRLGLIRDGQNIDSKFQEFQFHGGIMAQILMPRISESFYFKTGILYSPYRYYDIFTQSLFIKSLFIVPLHFEYISPSGIIRPKLAGGVKLLIPADKQFYVQQPTAVTCLPSLSFGLNIKLSKSLFWAINFEALYFNALTTGLFIPL